MDAELAAVEVALRVLTAINEGRIADDADVEKLRRLAPSLADLPLDELACDVIKQALLLHELKRKTEDRG